MHGSPGALQKEEINLRCVTLFIAGGWQVDSVHAYSYCGNGNGSVPHFLSSVRLSLEFTDFYICVYIFLCIKSS